MTGPEMITEFDIGFDVFSSGASLGFNSTRKYSIINRAYDWVIDRLIESKNFALLGDLFNAVEYNDCPDYYFSGNEGWLELPTDYWRYLSSISRISRSAFSSTGVVKSLTGSMRVENRYVSPSIFYKMDIPNSYLGHDNYVRFKKPVCTIGASIYTTENSALHIKGDYYTTISSADLQYVKKRSAISASQTCELAEKAHRDVVNKAIDLAKQIVNVQEPQSTK